MGSPRQEYWSGLPFPPPGDVPDPGIEPKLCISCIAGGFFTTSAILAYLILYYPCFLIDLRVSLC